MSRRQAVPFNKAQELWLMNNKNALDSFTAEPKATAFPGSAVAFGSVINESLLSTRSYDRFECESR
jgi:hypothetical protein